MSPVFAPVGPTSARLCQGAAAGIDTVKVLCCLNGTSLFCPFDVDAT